MTPMIKYAQSTSFTVTGWAAGIAPPRFYDVSVALTDLLNPLTWLGHLRGERELEIAEERLRVEHAAKLGARYKSGKPPTVSQTSWSHATGTIQNYRIETTRGSKSVRHVLLVYCAGPWYAEEVAVWLAYGDDREVRRTDEELLGLLRPGDPEREVVFVETEFAGGCVPRDGALMARWTDSNDTHIEPLLALTVHI